MSKLKIIDLWAPWCQPCKNLTPVIDRLEEKYKDEIEVERINVDEDDNAAIRYDVRGIPTVLYVKNNEIVARVVGLKPVKHYEELVVDNL
jgi:thioredoxin 1